jgi:hypothetical protein
MNDLIAQFLYASWRLEMWSLNYGSYNDIDRDVASGKLTPGVIPDGLREAEGRRRLASDQERGDS